MPWRQEPLLVSILVAWKWYSTFTWKLTTASPNIYSDYHHNIHCEHVNNISSKDNIFEGIIHYEHILFKGSFQHKDAIFPGIGIPLKKRRSIFVMGILKRERRFYIEIGPRSQWWWSYCCGWWCFSALPRRYDLHKYTSHAWWPKLGKYTRSPRYLIAVYVWDTSWRIETHVFITSIIPYGKYLRD